MHFGMDTTGRYLDHNSIVPLYAQVARQIREDINAGRFDATSRLPTEIELAEQYEISRITVRRAVDELVAQGLVEKKQGKGTFIATPKLKKSFSTHAIGFTEMCAANGSVARAKLLEAGLMAPESHWVREQLGLEPGQTAVRIRRLRYADDTPLVLEENFYPIEYAYLLSIDLEHDSTYRYLREEKGIDMFSAHISLRIVRADAKASKLLEVPRNTPQLQMTGVVTKLDGSILHTSYQLGYGENFDFVVR